MAIYHFSAKVISRANGSSAVASAAYRSASQLPDERLGRSHDFSNKAGVIHSEVLLPEGAPEHLADRATLWNTVERGEKRKDAQLARDIEFAIPRELSREQGVALAREFVGTQFVQRGMVADLNVHWDFDEAGLAKPHAHVMLSMRAVDERGFGPKVREWNSPELLKQWREAWATLANQRLAELDIDVRIDHRTLEAQGIALEPQHKIGPAGARRELRGEEAERADEHARIARDNGTKIIAEPGVALDAITRGQATFTVRDLARFVHRHSDGKAQFDAAITAVRGSPELVALGQDGRGEERFTSREMIAVEARLERSAGALAGHDGHAVGDRHRVAALAAAEGRGLLLSVEQRSALAHVTGEQGLASVIGYAGSGKSAMLGVAREAWEAAGYRVRGAALSGIAAENLEGSGIGSRTIASLEHQWGRGRELLDARDVLVIDEAGMIGTQQMERVLSAAAAAGAKVVLVGDPEQLQAIEAGAAFRSVAERHGWQEITTIRRQRDDWQRDATRQLATGRTAEAVRGYGERGMVHAADSREAARRALVDGWERGRQAEPEKSRIILTHTNAEVRDLNELARGRLRAAGGLGEDVAVATARGAKCFAAGDRLMFLKNERGLGGHYSAAQAVAVKNGTLGTVIAIESGGERLTVRLDNPASGAGREGRDVTFYTRDYAHIDHGYAATLHKSQGVTVDQTHILATPGMDRHSAYVGLSRHRDSVQLHYGRDDFADQRQLVRTLSRERAKDMASDYGAERETDDIRAFADRREIRLPEPSVTPVPEALPEAAPVRARAKGIFAGFRPKTAVPSREIAAREVVAPAPVPDSIKAVERYARAVADMQRMTSAGLPVLPHQEQARVRAGEALDRLRPDGAQDLLAAFTRDPGLIDEAVAGRTKAALQAMVEEGRVRTDPALRADRFVETWRAAEAERDRLGQTRDYKRADQAEARLTELNATLNRDSQMLAVLRDRVRGPEREITPGLPVPERERLISRELSQAIEPERMRGQNLGR